ncbi:hypothetical protein ASZ78_013987 [Callipepla squamata]|uniref:C2H2-type domain-containing protein n=1 Tax=Callipepla squamata TaxID=9009 RepID=A0A226N367_CALSU|nr:hypothetical protein ASZ78_013987 [Callipepla squamata]
MSAWGVYGRVPPSEAAHPEPEPPPGALRPELECPFCGEAAGQQLEAHVRARHGRLLDADTENVEQLYECPICGLTCTDIQILEEHVDLHLEEHSFPEGRSSGDLELAQRLQNEEDKQQRLEEEKREKEEFKKLQRQYGLDSSGGYKQQFLNNMEREVNRGRMQPFEYHKRKADMMESLAFGIDDGKTKTSGHSRTIVGIEEKKNKTLCLLLFDPGCPSQEMQKLLKLSSDGTSLRLLRKFMGNLKDKQYQIVAVDGILTVEEKTGLRDAAQKTDSEINNNNNKNCIKDEPQLKWEQVMFEDVKTGPNKGLESWLKGSSQSKAEGLDPHRCRDELTAILASANGACSPISDSRLTMEPSKEFVFNYKGFYFAVHTTPERVASLENFEIKDSDIFIATYPKSACSPISDSRLTMEPSKEFVFNYKGFYFAVHTTPERVASLENFEIKDSDIFIATYPKSGHRNGTEQIENLDRIPWVEYNFQNMDVASLPTPRVFATHLPYYLTPRDLRNKKGRVIYVARNPKDVLVSYFHFSKFMRTLEKIPDFNIFMERFLAGKGWYNHANDFNILFLTYEEMKKDLRSAVLKICNFIGKQLSEEEIESVVRQATFENMQKDPRANYENMPDDIMVKGKGKFLRKGTVGDWKNMMTVAQSERFDEVLKEKMQTLPIKFTWDMDSDM